MQLRREGLVLQLCGAARATEISCQPCEKQSTPSLPRGDRERIGGAEGTQIETKS